MLTLSKPPSAGQAQSYPLDLETLRRIGYAERSEPNTTE
jgi:hypothetical protein